MVLAEQKNARTFLAFSDLYARFAAAKVYQLDPYHDAAYRERMQQRLSDVQNAFTEGIAFPLGMSVQDERICQLTELLPGHSLQEIVEWHGPLSTQDVFLVARRVLQQVIHARESYRVSPNFSPDQVQLWQTGSVNWKLGFSDYDLRREYGEGGVDEAREAFGQLALLLYYMGTGDLRTTVPTKTGDLAASWLKKSSPELWWFYLQLFRDANAPGLCDLEQLLARVESHCTQKTAKLELGNPPLDRPFLNWLPQHGEFPQPFESRGRNLDPWQTGSFAAVDQLREAKVQLHLLPPQSMTQGARFESSFQEMRQIACDNHAWQMPVQSVMVDPSCRVVAEKSSPGIPLSVVLEGRDSFRAEEALHLLEKASVAISYAERAWAEVGETPSLDLNDLVLIPGPDVPTSSSWRDQCTWLADPSAYEVRLRPFKSNPFFEVTPNTAALHSETNVSLQERLFLPEHSFAALAYRLMTKVMESKDTPLPDAAALMFRKVLALRRSNEGYLRRYMIAKLRRVLGIKGKAHELPPEFALAKSKVGVAAASASASVLVFVALGLAFLR